MRNYEVEHLHPWQGRDTICVVARNMARARRAVEEGITPGTIVCEINEIPSIPENSFWLLESGEIEDPRPSKFL